MSEFLSRPGATCWTLPCTEIPSDTILWKQEQNINLHFRSRPGWIIRVLLRIIPHSKDSQISSLSHRSYRLTLKNAAVIRKPVQRLYRTWAYFQTARVAVMKPEPHLEPVLCISTAKNLSLSQENRFKCGTNTLLVWNQEPHMSEAGGGIIVTK